MSHINKTRKEIASCLHWNWQIKQEHCKLILTLKKFTFEFCESFASSASTSFIWLHWGAHVAAKWTTLKLLKNNVVIFYIQSLNFNVVFVNKISYFPGNEIQHEKKWFQTSTSELHIYFHYFILHTLLFSFNLNIISDIIHTHSSKDKILKTYLLCDSIQ